MNKIIKNKNIIFLWVGHFISHIGDSIYIMALPWLILDLTGSKTSTALVMTSVYLPTLIFGLFAGTLADRFPRKSVMMISDYTKMVTMQNLFHDGGFSSVGISQEVIDKFIKK